jgi:hypothetical protein
LLDQRFFNGVGNYVRAELLWFAKVPPFSRAVDVLEALLPAPGAGADGAPGSAAGGAVDLLQVVRDMLCTCVERCGDKRWLSVFRRSYSSREVDGNGRIIWFRGARGPLAGPVIVNTPWQSLSLHRLPASMSPAALRLLLSVFGPIEHCTHNVPKRYAFVRYRDTEAARSAKEALAARPVFQVQTLLPQGLWRIRLISPCLISPSPPRVTVRGALRRRLVCAVHALT